MTHANNENDDQNEYIHESTVEVDLPALFGDLCEIEGYGHRVFKVFGYRIENCYTEKREWTDVVYELVDAVNGEWIEADVEDVELLADAEVADVYMQTVDYENYPKSTTYILGVDLGAPDGDGWSVTNTERGGGNMAKGERKLTARELSAKLAEERKEARKEREEAIDNELDRYNFFKRQYEQTKDRRYKESMERVLSDVNKLRQDGE